MSDTTNSDRLLIVVLDTEFGEKLRDIWPGAPVWVALSEANKPVYDALCSPVIAALSVTNPYVDHFTALSGFYPEPNDSPEKSFLQNLDMIDLHHGSYSTTEPYTTIRVIGAELNDDIRSELSNLGFTDFVVRDNEFVAVRTLEEASRER